MFNEEQINAAGIHAARARLAITSTTERIHERARELDAGDERVLAFAEDLGSETAAQRLVEAVLYR